MTFRKMKLVILLKASVLSHVLPKIHESKAPALQTLQKTTLPATLISARCSKLCLKLRSSDCQCEFLIITSHLKSTV